MIKFIDAKFMKEISTHEKRLKSIASYRSYFIFHMILALILGVMMIIAFGDIGSNQGTPTLMFLVTVNFLIAYKHDSTRKMIQVVDFIESSKNNEAQHNETNKNA